jgi:hypothetical protein
MRERERVWGLRYATMRERVVGEKVMIRPAGKREMVGKEGEGLDSELKERSLPNCTIVVTGPPLCSMGEELPHIGT